LPVGGGAFEVDGAAEVVCEDVDGAEFDDILAVSSLMQNKNLLLVCREKNCKKRGHMNLEHSVRCEIYYSSLSKMQIYFATKLHFMHRRYTRWMIDALN